MSSSGILRRQLTPFEPLVRQIESAEALDDLGQKIASKLRQVLSQQPLKDVVSGTWLGHAVHPMLTDVVIGSFTSATLLDLISADSDEASRRLIGLGALAYVPTAITGANDWADTEPVDETIRRAGLVHASSNAVALSLYLTSLARRRSSGKGKLVGLAGLAVLLAGGYLGGHLSLTKGVGPDQTVFDPGPDEWTEATDASQLSDGQPLRVVVADTPVLLTRDGERVFAIHDRCSHRGCSLSEGEVQGDEIVCSCHGSRFDRRDGSVRQGPATAPQPAFEVRQQDGKIEVRLMQPATV